MTGRHRSDGFERIERDAFKISRAAGDIKAIERGGAQAGAAPLASPDNKITSEQDLAAAMTGGASGLPNVAAQTREVWAIVAKVRES
jgi:hypothetical protein